VEIFNNIFNLRKEFYSGKQKIVYYEEGEGFPFLVIHGWGIIDSPKRNLPFIKTLAKRGFKVYQVSLPGFGESSLPELKSNKDELTESIVKFADEMKISQFLVYGHSAGGLIASKLESKEPKKFKVIVLNSVPCPFRIRLLSRIGIVGIIPFLAVTGFLGVAIPPIFFLKEIRNYFKNTYIFFRREKATMWRAWNRLINNDFRESFSNIEKIVTPTLVIRGEKEPFLIKAGSDFFMKKPNSLPEVVRGQGHGMITEIPEFLADKIMDFIKINYLILQKELLGLRLDFIKSQY
jgi:pimeloyl-ACP methyl ester carboxylesterase